MTSLKLNAVSDHWFDQCFDISNNLMASVSNAFDRLFQYDCIVTVGFQILIIFPVLFKIYGFGVQQRLRKFYDTSRGLFISFLFLCSFSMAICTLIHLWIQQPMPCLIWDGRTLSPGNNSSRSPNEELIIILILARAIWSLKFGHSFFRKLTCITIVLLDYTAALLSGVSSISQIILSVSIGFWIMCLYELLPPIGIPISCVLGILAMVTVFSLNYPRYGFQSDLICKSLHYCIKSTIVLAISCLLQLRFGFSRDSFDWFAVGWGPRWKTNDSDSSDDVIIPSMVREAPVSDFGKVLKFDLIDSLIAFILFLLGNTGLYIADKSFQFMTE